MAHVRAMEADFGEENGTALGGYVERQNVRQNKALMLMSRRSRGVGLERWNGAMGGEAQTQARLV